MIKQLWEDQIKIVSETSKLLSGDKNRVLIYSPTGGGKTTIAAHLIANVFRAHKHLFLVNRDALILQVYEELQEFGQNSSIFAANYPTYFNPQERVQIASIQTIESRGLEFIESSNDTTELFVWLDEAHLTAFTQIGTSFFNRPNTRVIGLTATPERTSPYESLGDKFHHLVKGAMPWELISQGRLKKPIYYRLNDLYDLESAEGIKFCVREWKRLARRRQTILFAANVDHAHRVSAAFNADRIDFHPIDANTPIAVRPTIFNSLRTQQINGLTSFDALSEGFNVQNCSCVMLLRNTDSRSKYYQQLGRGLRWFPGINDCVVLDFVGLSSEERFGCIEDILDISLDNSKSAFEVSDIPKKVCPKCSALIYNFHLQCSQCGYRFSKKSLPSLPPEAELIQHLSLRERGMVLSYRQKLRQAYESQSSLSQVQQDFETQFQQKPLPEWRKGAIFNSKATIQDQAKFLQYLQGIAANEGKPQSWVQEQFVTEFQLTAKR